MTYVIKRNTEVWAILKIPSIQFTGNDTGYWYMWQNHMDNVMHLGDDMWWAHYKRRTTERIELEYIEEWKNEFTSFHNDYVFVPLVHNKWVGYIVHKTFVEGEIKQHGHRT